MRSLRAMIHSKNKAGFTLIEVMLATLIVGVVLGPIYLLQGTVFKRVVRMADSVERMLITYDYFIDVQKGDEDVVSETVKDPQTEIKYERKQSSPGSALTKEFNHLLVDKISWHWNELDMPYSEAFVSIVFAPPEEKEEAPQQEESKEKPAVGADKPKTDDKKTGESVKKGEEKKEGKTVVPPEKSGLK